MSDVTFVKYLTSSCKYNPHHHWNSAINDHSYVPDIWHCALAAAVNYSSYLIYTHAVSYSSRTQVHLTHNLNFKVIAETDGAALMPSRMPRNCLNVLSLTDTYSELRFPHTHAHTHRPVHWGFFFFFLFFPQWFAWSNHKATIGPLLLQITPGNNMFPSGGHVLHQMGCFYHISGCSLRCLFVCTSAFPQIMFMFLFFVFHFKNCIEWFSHSSCIIVFYGALLKANAHYDYQHSVLPFLLRY